MCYALITILLLLTPSASSFLLSSPSFVSSVNHQSQSQSQSKSIIQGSGERSGSIQQQRSNRVVSVATGAGAESNAGNAAEDSGGESLAPQTFREAEILGLRLMQQNRPGDALEVFQNGLKLPGSRKDILRTKTLNVSPVGGSVGGSTGENIQTLDEFEAQAAHYNIACAYSKLDKAKEAVRSLENAFKFGFDNYATVRADPDLMAVQRTKEFEVLMEQYDPKKGFPFSLFGKK